MGCINIKGIIKQKRKQYIEQTTLNQIENLKIILPFSKKSLIKTHKEALEDVYTIVSFHYRSSEIEIARIINKKHNFERLAKIFPLKNEKIPKKYQVEYEILSSFDCFNIIKLHEAYLEYNKCSFIMDSLGISNMNIKEWADLNSPLSEKSIVQIIKQLLKGLKYIHSKGILHNNITSKSILVHISHMNKNQRIIHNNSNLKLTDSDMIVHPIYINFTKAINGSSVIINKEAYNFNEYTAFEVANKGKYSIKSEIWSIGVVIFKMICGCGIYGKYSDAINRLDMLNNEKYKADCIEEEKDKFKRNLWKKAILNSIRQCVESKRSFLKNLFCIGNEEENNKINNLDLNELNNQSPIGDLSQLLKKNKRFSLLSVNLQEFFNKIFTIDPNQRPGIDELFKLGLFKEKTNTSKIFIFIYNYE